MVGKSKGTSPYKLGCFREQKGERIKKGRVKAHTAQNGDQMIFMLA